MGDPGKSGAGKTTEVVIRTSMGEISVALDGEKAPITTGNFLRYVSEKHYDGTIFHRVIDGFMIQGGGFTPDMKERSVHAPIQLESQNGLKNRRGAIAMARTSVPDSATSQFFISVVDNAFLDWRPGRGGEGYAVFGQVTKGLDVVDAIRKVKTANRGGHEGVPAEPVVIESIRVAG